MVVEGERPSMPHVPRPVIVTVEASPAEVEEVAREALGLHRDDDGTLTGSLPDWTDPNARVRVGRTQCCRLFPVRTNPP